MNSVEFGKRFGTLAVEKGFVGPDQVCEALEVQVRENMNENKHRYIGTIMTDLGYLKRAQVNEVLGSLFNSV